MNRLRSPESYPIAFLVSLLLLGAVTGGWGLSRYAALTAATAAPTPAATASVSPSPDAAPAGALAPDDLRVFAVGPIPEDHRFALLGEGGDERLLLLDLAGRTVRVVGHFEGKGQAVDRRGLEVTATRDGSLVVVLLRSDADHSRIFAIRPVAGDVFSFEVPSASMPRVTPDGSSVVIAHADGDPSRHGVWRFDTTTGIGAVWITDDPARSPPDPIGWSSDGEHLALLVDPDGTDKRVAVTGGDIAGLRVLGPGTSARWRGQELLVWNSRAAGGGVLVYDVASGAAAAAFPPQSDTTIDRIEARPSSTDIAALERTPGSRQQVVVHGTQAAAAAFAIPQPGQIIAFWWSSDGARLYAWTNDNGTTSVTELFGNTLIVQFCLRRGVAPPCS